MAEENGVKGGDSLTYRGTTWRVQSEPVVIESEGDSDLVEVWVTRGEGIDESSES